MALGRLSMAVFLFAGLGASMSPLNLAVAQDYQAGLDAVDDGDLSSAVTIWRELIATNSEDRPQAEYALALLHETGQGVGWDELRAAELYASSGLPEAITNLALMYAEGRGVNYDPTRAAALWQSAADQGHAFASFNLGLAYYNGQGVEQNALRALELIFEAGAGGLPEAQWAVCQFFEKGVGVEINFDEAALWCQRAAIAGHVQAAEALPDLLVRAADEPPADPVALPAPDGPALPSVSALARTADDIATLFEAEPTSTPLVSPPAEGTTPDPVSIPSLEQASAGREGLSLQAMVDGLNRGGEKSGVGANTRGEGNKVSSVPLTEPEHADDDAMPPVPVPRPKPVYSLPDISAGDPVFALWLGSGDAVTEVAALYANVSSASPEVFALMETAYQREVLKAAETGLPDDITVTRLLVGPVPGPDYAWSLCNFLRTRREALFCQPLEVSR